MAFEKFDPNNKPVTDFNNEWQKLPDGTFRQKLKDDCKPIEVDVEVLELEIAIHLVTTEPGACIVVGIHADASAGETKLSSRGEQVVEDFLALGFGQQLKSIPVEFVEGGAPCLELKSLVGFEHADDGRLVCLAAQLDALLLDVLSFSR